VPKTIEAVMTQAAPYESLRRLPIWLGDDGGMTGGRERTSVARPSDAISLQDDRPAFIPAKAGFREIV